MSDTFYNLGYSMVVAVPILIAVFCAMRIRKNRAEIKKMEKDNKDK